MSFKEILNVQLPMEVIELCEVDVEDAEYDIFLSGSRNSLDRRQYLMEIHRVDQPESRHPELIDSFLAREFSGIGRTPTRGGCFIVRFGRDQIVGFG